MQDSHPDTLRDLIITLAVAEGEHENDLSGLMQVRGIGFSAQPGALVFNVDIPNIQYSNPYAACHTFSALESDGRYFKLDEIKA